MCAQFERINFFLNIYFANQNHCSISTKFVIRFDTPKNVASGSKFFLRLKGKFFGNIKNTNLRFRYEEKSWELYLDPAK